LVNLEIAIKIVTYICVCVCVSLSCLLVFFVPVSDVWCSYIRSQQQPYVIVASFYVNMWQHRKLYIVFILVTVEGTGI